MLLRFSRPPKYLKALYATAAHPPKPFKTFVGSNTSRIIAAPFSMAAHFSMAAIPKAQGYMLESMKDEFCIADPRICFIYVASNLTCIILAFTVVTSQYTYVTNIHMSYFLCDSISICATSKLSQHRDSVNIFCSVDGR